MKEIKFRAWDKAHGMVSQPAFGNMGGGDTIILNELLAVPEQVKLMQYTGLKDKNGKEIYEGDILRRYSQQDTPQNTVTVTWVEGKGFYPAIQSYYPKATWEIIGNIYENSDLLTKKE